MHYLLNQKNLVFLLLDLEGALWHRTAVCRDRHRRDKEGSKGRREGHDRQHRAGRRDRRQGVQSEGYGLSVFVPLFRVIGGTNTQTAVIVVKRHNNLTIAILPRNWCKFQITAKKGGETPLFGSFRPFSSVFDPQLRIYG